MAKHKECEICKTKATTELRANITIASISGILESDKIIEQVYICENSECQQKAAKRIKKSIKHLLHD